MAKAPFGVRNYRSSVKGRKPAVADMDYGDLAINYNHEDPALIIKGDDNALIEFKPGSGVTVGAAAPATAKDGDLWWDTTSARLFVRFTSGSPAVSTWVDASPAAVPPTLANALVFKGSKAPGDAAPGTPASGDVWVMSAAGTMAASWTGVAGLAVVKDGTIAWNGSEWISLGIDPPTPDATETTKGIVELATAAETTTGTDATRAVHPAGLKVELDKKVRLAGDTMTGNLTVPSLNGGPLAGFRNVLINGTLGFNTRNVTIAAAAVGQYGPDRWKKVDAGHMTQIVEDGNFERGATYTLSGTGVTTQQLVAPAAGNWTLPNIPIAASRIQLEPGTVATPFEQRPNALEFPMCCRYYEEIHVQKKWDGTLGGASISVGYSIQFATTKRAVPTLQAISKTAINATAVTLTPIYASGVYCAWAWNTDGVVSRMQEFKIVADAEL